MSRNSMATALKFGAVAILLFALLLADNIWRASPSLLGSIFREITSVFRDPSTQWMTAMSLTGYFILFLFLERRTGSNVRHRWFTNSNIWLAAFVGLVLLRYAFAYQTAWHSTQVCVLLAGIVIGKGYSLWIAGGLRFRHPTASLSPVEAERECRLQATWLTGLLVCWLAGAALLRPEMTSSFQYHGITRWSGVWDNPNLYGLLMGAGVGLSFGFLILNLKSRGWWLIPIILAAGLCGIGLFKSYSRGAWLGTALGMVYLIGSGLWRLGSGVNPSSILHPPSFRVIQWWQRNRLPLAIILTSIFVLAFWQCRFSEWRPAQRAFSATNANDFSWRNRVTAWNGAIHMMADRPLTGFGWGQAEPAYGKKYCPLNESAAIEMNDYFMLGISTGVPALICFLVYIGLCFKPNAPSPRLGPLPCLLERRGNVQTICRAGAVVLLVGFWFDGGLFKLPTVTVFWMLIELSRLELRRGHLLVGDEVTSLNLEPGKNLEAPYVVSYPKRERWLRWIAWILAAVALLQTTVYLGTPFLQFDRKTLTIARKCLVPPKELNDFDFLTTQSIWHGQKLKTLLENVDLANYNRQLINWQLDEKMYQEYVLSPVINQSTDFNWRRPLWEEFYPRIRHESSIEDAAKIVARHLRERVTIAGIPNPPRDVSTIWLRQITDKTGFQIIYVAALRSVGIPARLNKQQAEFWNSSQWQIAPLPAIISW